jgi:hypothetical protein
LAWKWLFGKEVNDPSAHTEKDAAHRLAVVAVQITITASASASLIHQK